VSNKLKKATSRLHTIPGLLSWMYTLMHVSPWKTLCKLLSSYDQGEPAVSYI
jgi:hypothetical protein